MTDLPGRSLSFDPVADDYDRTRVIPAPPLEEIARLCAREARLKQGGRFLDAGVGTGRFAAPLSRLHPGQIVGIDLSTAMMARAQAKTPRGSLSLVNADLQRLPFPSGVFAGALVVHILHLVERWTLVLSELRRVLAPGGVLLFGGEQGGRSILVDFYYERARARQCLASSLGAPGKTQALAYLRRGARQGGGGAHVESVSASALAWKRVVPVSDILAALARRTYSQMWSIPDDAHQALLAETTEYARRSFPSLDASETLDATFSLHAVRWPT